MQLLSLFQGGKDPAAAQRRRRKRAAKRALAASLRSDAPPARLTEPILDYWWSLADEDQDGTLAAPEAVRFLNLSGLPREALARVWNAAKAANGVRGQLSRPEFAAALRLTGMAQQSLALLDSGLTIGRAVSGKLALKPRLEGVDDVPTAQVCEVDAPASAPKSLVVAPLALWASPLEALRSTDDAQPPLLLPRPAATAPPAPPVRSSGPGSDVVSPAQRVLAAAAAEREAADAAVAAAAAAARRAREEAADSSDDDAAVAPRPKISVRIKQSTSLDASAPPPKPVALAPPPGALGGGVKPAPLTFKPGGSAEEATAPLRKPPPPPPRAPPRAVAVLHEEQRMLWASEKLLAAGVRGSVLVLPRDGGRGDVKLTLRGAALACAALAPASALHASAAVTRRAASSAPWAPLRARDADVAERWRRARDAAADAAFLAATAPTRVDVRCAAALGAPAAACGYALGARASAPALRCALRRRPLVIPFGAGAAIAVAVAGGPLPLADLAVTLHLGAPFASAPDAGIDIAKASGPGRGEWREAERAFTWRVGDVAAGAPPQLLQLHIGARRDGDGGDGVTWQPLHAVLTARVVPPAAGDAARESAAALLSGIEAELRMPDGGGVLLSASVRATVYASAADAADALRAATRLPEPTPSPAEAPAEAVRAAPDDEAASPPASPAHTAHSSATAEGDSADSDDGSSSADEGDDGSPPATPGSGEPRAPPSAEKPLPATALFDFAAGGDGELAAAAGDALWVLSPEFEGWVMARRVRDGARGVLPSSVVALEPGEHMPEDPAHAGHHAA